MEQYKDGNTLLRIPWNKYDKNHIIPNHHHKMLKHATMTSSM